MLLLISNFKWLLIGLGLMVVVVAIPFLQTMGQLWAKGILRRRDGPHDPESLQRDTDKHVQKIFECLDKMSNVDVDEKKRLSNLEDLMTRFVESMEQHNRFTQDFLLRQEKISLRVEDIHSRIFQRRERAV